MTDCYAQKKTTTKIPTFSDNEMNIFNMYICTGRSNIRDRHTPTHIMKRMVCLRSCSLSKKKRKDEGRTLGSVPVVAGIAETLADCDSYRRRRISIYRAVIFSLLSVRRRLRLLKKKRKKKEKKKNIPVRPLALISLIIAGTRSSTVY